MTMITSAANQRIRDIRALRMRKTREQTGLCYVEGIRAVGEAVQTGAQIDMLVVAPALLTSDFAKRLVAEAAARGVEVLEVAPTVFQALSERDGPHGLAAVARQRWVRLDRVQFAPTDCWVALDEVADPGNLGTVLRTADASNASGVVLLGHSTDPYDPTAIRASTGAVFSRPVARASFGELVALAHADGVRLVGSSATGDTDYREADYGGPTLLLIGSEREGLSPAQREACDTLVRIPMRGRASSLNVAVATAILLYEVLRHRDALAGA